jgi:hypothetical protein
LTNTLKNASFSLIGSKPTAMDDIFMLEGKVTAVKRPLKEWPLSPSALGLVYKLNCNTKGAFLIRF